MFASPTIIVGNCFTDERGTLRFCNSFDLSEFRRFYMILHHLPNIVRGWQGHKLETKAFYVTQGSFEIHTCSLETMDEKYSSNLPLQFMLSSTNQKLLIVPAGFATAIRSIKKNAQLMVFSDLSLEDSAMDDYRYYLSKFPLPFIQ